MEKNSRQAQQLRFLKAILPDISWLIRHIERSGGWLNLRADFADALRTLGICWWNYYEDSQKLRALSLLMFFPEAEAKILAKGDSVEAIKALLSEVVEIDWDSLMTPNEEEIRQFQHELESASEEERLEVSKIVAIWLTAIVGTLFNVLAIMTHGRSMCQLVADAKDGDDDAFARAVQVDRTVLELPYFRERMMRAQLGRDDDLLRKVAYRLKNPILNSKIRYRELWLAFAFLQEEGLLDLRREELLDVCEELGVYGKEFGIEDVGHLSKRLHEFRRLQRNRKDF